MALTADDFDAFFADLHGGFEPFAWQRRLLDVVLSEGQWPQRINAPTGAGKTAVIDVHVFAQALTVELDPSLRPPRRLSLVVGRRVLVDDQHDYARAVAARLRTPDTDVLAEVARCLWQLHRPGAVTEVVADASPLVVGRLRGGQPPSRAWLDLPTAAAVICATPDMWGSRLLFRAYGSSRRAWPRAAGLLAMDSVVVVDEAHLSRQLLVTARRVAQLASVAPDAVPAKALQVVETTATSADPSQPEGVERVVGVSGADVEVPGTLTDRLTRPKPVTLVPVPGWPGTGASARRATAETLADQVVAHRRAPAVGDVGSTVGCFVNTVSAAVDVTAELRRRTTADGRPLSVVMLCGQVRPHDLDQLRAEHPGVLSPQGSPDVDVIVATQSLEVGVDLDLAAMVSELPSGSAVAQRAGRVNRRGLRESGPITVVVPAQPVTEMTRSGPYGAEDLDAAGSWLEAMATADFGLAPSALSANPPPVARSRRALYQRPELAQVWHWARTSDDLAAEPELDLWLGEDFETDTSIGVVVRHALPRQQQDALRLVDDLPPQRHETFPVPYRTAVSALAQWRADAEAANATTHDEEPDSAIVVRGDDTDVLTWRPSRDGRDGSLPDIRPGDVVVVDDGARLFTTSTSGSGGFSPPVVAPADSDGGKLPRQAAADVLMAQADLPDEVWRRRAVGAVVLRLEQALAGDSFAALAAELSDSADGAGLSGSALARVQRTIVSDWLRRSGFAARSVMAAQAADLLSQDSTACELVIHRDLVEPDDGSAAPITRVIVRDRRRPDSDEGLRQVLSTSKDPVTLVAHQAAVARRAAIIGETVGLPTPLVEALSLAGAHHDDGKADPRFQRRLGASDALVLAKSRPGISPEQARRNDIGSGLPALWRHEQRSVVDSWDTVLLEVGAQVDPLLVQRLIGTTHGLGRPGFPHAGSELLPSTDAVALIGHAANLFDSGSWDELIESTQQRYGVWGCAYLEALLRAADGQVSQEGS